MESPKSNSYDDEELDAMLARADQAVKNGAVDPAIFYNLSYIAHTIKGLKEEWRSPRLRAQRLGQNKVRRQRTQALRNRL
jgi:hypothetical protein